MTVNINDILLDTELHTLSPVDDSVYNKTITPSGTMLLWTGSGIGVITTQFNNERFDVSKTGAFGTSNFTIEFDLYTNTSDYGKTIVGSLSFTGNGYSIGLHPTTGAVTFYTHSSHVATEVLTTTYSSAASNTVDRYAVVRNGSTLSIYRNGTLDSSTTVSFNISSSPAKFTIGGLDDASSSPSFGNISYMIGAVRVVVNNALYTSDYTANAPFFTRFPSISTSGGSTITVAPNTFIFTPHTVSYNTKIAVVHKSYTLIMNDVALKLPIHISTTKKDYIITYNDVTIRTPLRVTINHQNYTSTFNNISTNIISPIGIVVSTNSYIFSSSIIYFRFNKSIPIETKSIYYTSNNTLLQKVLSIDSSSYLVTANTLFYSYVPRPTSTLLTVDKLSYTFNNRTISIIVSKGQYYTSGPRIYI